MRLPFERGNSKGGWGRWVSRHRIGLLSTTVVFLITGIAFFSYKIVVNQAVEPKMITFEFEQKKVPVPEKTPQKEEPRKIESIDPIQSTPSNRVSNASGKLNSSLKDSKGTNANKLYADMERVKRDMAAGKRNYDKAMAGIGSNATRQKQTKPPASSSRAGSKSPSEVSEKARGDVFVEYELGGRNHVYLHIPAYQCQYGGSVVVAVVVNRTGRVVAANVERATVTGDDCISTMALQSALASTFAPSNTAPEKHRGTITYRFVPQ